MAWLVLLALLFFFLLGIVVLLRRQENRYLKKKVSEAMGKNLKFEIQREKIHWQRRHQKFENFLERKKSAD